MAGHSYVLEAARQAPELGTYSIAWWQLDEAAAATNFIDDDAAFDLTQANSPGVVAGPRSNDGTTGARSFNGTTQWASRAHDAHEGYFQSTDGWTLQAWIWVDPAMSTGTIVAFESFASPETQATNVQARLSVQSARTLRLYWEHSAGTNVVTSTPSTVTVPESVWTHVAVVVDVDPENFDKRRITFYVNGDPVHIASNLTPPDGGTSSFWQIGAAIGSSVDGGVTPVEWWDGNLADVGFYNRAMTWDFVRRNYARAIRDFDVRSSAGFAAAAPGQLEHYETHVRVLVQDVAATAPEHRYAGGWVDLSTYLGHNWIRSVRISDELEAQARHASVTLTARNGTRTLAATRVGADVSGGVSLLENEAQTGTLPLLDGGVVVRIEAAVVPVGSFWPLDRRSSWGADDYEANRKHALDAHWMLVFEGSIVASQVSGNDVNVECIDKMGALQDQWSEPNGASQTGADMPLGSSGGTALETNLQSFIDWQNPARLRFSAIDDSGAGSAVVITFFQSSATYPLGYGRPHLLRVGDVFEITNTTNYNGVYTVASISGQTVTTVETKGGLAAETSGIAWCSPSTHGYIGARSNRDGSFELYTPTSPGWNQYTYTPGHSQPVATLLEEQAGQIQWACRFVWDDELAEYRLTLCRSPSNDGRYLSPRLVRKVESIGYDSTDARNIALAEYTDTTTADTDGNRGRRRVVASTRNNEAARIRRRYARVSLDAANNIDTSTEATTLTNNIIDDCASLATPQMRAELVFAPEIDLGDVPWIFAEYARAATGEVPIEAIPLAFGPFYPEFAAIGLEHNFDANGARTSLTLRGLVSAASFPARGRKIFEIVDGNGQVQGSGTTAIDSTLYSAVPTCTVLRDGLGVRGVFVRWTLPTTLARRWDFTEVHLDTVNNFTPTSSTRDAAVRGETCTIWGLTAGTTYYVKLVHRDAMKNTLTSTQTSFIA